MTEQPTPQDSSQKVEERLAKIEADLQSLQKDDPEKSLSERLSKIEASLSELKGAVAAPAPEEEKAKETLRERITRERQGRIEESRKRREAASPNRRKDPDSIVRNDRNVVQPPEKAPQRPRAVAPEQFIPLEFYCWIEGEIGRVIIPLQIPPEKLE